MIQKGFANDDASSANVYNGCVLIIYQHSRFNGASATYKCNKGIPGGWCRVNFNSMNDQMSSLKVCNLNGSGC